MAVWDYPRLKKSLADRDFSNLYCLYGEETYLLEEALGQLTASLLEGCILDFNLDSYHMPGVDLSQVRDVIETLPMMAPRRVVVVREAQHLKSKDLEVLLPIVETPVETTVLILTASKIDQRLKFFKDFQKGGPLIKFDRPYENQIPGWIRYIVQKHELTIDNDAVERIQQWVGVNLLDIDNEVRKLAQYLGDRKHVTLKDVEAIVSRIRVNSVFALAHAIGVNDRSAALMCLAQLLDHGENSVGVLSMISRHVRILTLVKEGLREGLNTSQLASRVGVPNFFLKEYMDQCRGWSEAKLRATHEALLATDQALKSSPVSTHIWLENFVIQTCGV